MLSSWKKIVACELFLFSLFALFLYPVVSKTTDAAFFRSMEQNAADLLKEISPLKNEEDLIRKMEQKSLHLFYRVTIFDAYGKPLFDSNKIEDEGNSISKIIEAVDSAASVWKKYCPFFDSTFVFAAKRFYLNEKPYVIRAGYPETPVNQFNQFVTIGFLGLSSFFLLLFIMLTALIIKRVSRPIDEIIDLITPFQEGKDGTLPWIHPLQAVQSNEFSKLALTLNALSEQVEKQMEHLRKQKRESEGILESLGEGVVAFNAKGEVTFQNRSASKMLSIDVDLFNKGQDLVHQVLQTGESAMQTWTRGNGGRIFLELTATPIHQQNGAVLVLQDKTSDYKVVEMGKDFIANASHELKTPITIIRGFAETLHDLPKIDRASLQEITTRILRTSFRLEKLVKSLLTLADAEQLSSQRFRPLDLVATLNSCYQAAVVSHPETKIMLSINSPKALVLADPDLIEMALFNLIENGIRYSLSPAKIEIRLIENADSFSVQVKDSGIGIPESDLPHIFDRFYTVDKARSRKSGGAGLGLSIFKTIVEKHGGSFEVQSEMGLGSSFSFSLKKEEL